MSTEEIVKQYYQSLGQKDDRWQSMYAEEAVFSDASRVLNARGKLAVVQAFVPFLRGVAEVKLRDLIVEDDRACAVVDYVYVNPKGEKMSQSVAELWRVKNDQLSEETIYFDISAYRAFMRG